MTETTPEDRRKTGGHIVDRENFDRLPGGINMLRLGEMPQPKTTNLTEMTYGRP